MKLNDAQWCAFVSVLSKFISDERTKRRFFALSHVKTTLPRKNATRASRRSQISFDYTQIFSLTRSYFTTNFPEYLTRSLNWSIWRLQSKIFRSFLEIKDCIEGNSATSECIYGVFPKCDRVVVRQSTWCERKAAINVSVMSAVLRRRA